jgi:hypothetical protein
MRKLRDRFRISRGDDLRENTPLLPDVRKRKIDEAPLQKLYRKERKRIVAPGRQNVLRQGRALRRPALFGIRDLP